MAAKSVLKNKEKSKKSNKKSDVDSEHYYCQVTPLASLKKLEWKDVKTGPPAPFDSEYICDQLLNKIKDLTENKKLDTSLVIGVLGIGELGSRITKSLLAAGYSVVIWNRDPGRLEQFKSKAKIVLTPQDVAAESDLIISCVIKSAVHALIFGNCGVLKEINTGKGYIECSTIDIKMAKAHSEAIRERGGAYMVCGMMGSLKEIENGDGMVVVGGDSWLVDKCEYMLQIFQRPTLIKETDLQKRQISDSADSPKPIMTDPSIMKHTAGEEGAIRAITTLRFHQILDIIAIHGMVETAIIKRVDKVFPKYFERFKKMQNILRKILDLDFKMEMSLRPFYEVFENARANPVFSESSDMTGYFSERVEFLARNLSILKERGIMEADCTIIGVAHRFL